MNHTTRHAHTWSHLMARFALEMGTSDYRFGPLCFSLPDGPSIVAELLDGGSALALTVDLEHAPEPSRLELFMAANVIENAQDSGVYAVLESRNALLFFRRLEDAGQYAFEDLVAEMHGFAYAAQAALDALPNALHANAAPPTQDAWATHEDTFKHVWADMALAQGLGTEPPEPHDDGSFCLSLAGAGFVFVRPDNARGRVILKTMVALLPLINDEPTAWLALLHAHTLGQATGGAFFAIDTDAQELVAWRSLPMAELDGYSLNEAIERQREDGQRCPDPEPDRPAAAPKCSSAYESAGDASESDPSRDASASSDADSSIDAWGPGDADPSRDASDPSDAYPSCDAAGSNDADPSRDAKDSSGAQ